ncbi:hypothetical protein FQZ97_728660 [compost metagenome]
MSTFGRVRSHFASTIFCWLPPLKEPAGVSSECVLIARRPTSAADAFRSAPARVKPKGPVKSGRAAMEMFQPTLWPSTRPSSLRFSVTKPMPRAIASAGERKRTSLPSRRTVPLAFFMPKSAFITSDRPEPTRPKKPRISPAPTVKEISANSSSRVRRSTASTGAPGVERSWIGGG